MNHATNRGTLDNRHAYQVIEFHSDDLILADEAKLLAKWIREARHMTAFTGAGISTSAGISDFRGPQGVWTLRAQYVSTWRDFNKPAADIEEKKTKSQDQEQEQQVQAIPTPTHMSLAALEAAGFLKFLITQSLDGLHRRSGFPTEKLSELHGCKIVEFCSKCGWEYLLQKPSKLEKQNRYDGHRTKHNCPTCNCQLLDQNYTFETLPKEKTRLGFEKSRSSDLCIVLGSSITIGNAPEMLQETLNSGGRLMICNLQSTSLDDKAEMRVFAKTDHFMALVMKELGLTIAQWKLVRYLTIYTDRKETFRSKLRKLLSFDKSNIKLSGVTSDDYFPDNFIKQASLNRNNTPFQTLLEEPFLFPKSLASDPNVSITLQFMGHYAEPPLTLNIADILNQSADSEIRVTLTYNPIDRSWTVS